MYILAGVLGVFFAFSLIELIEILGLGNHLLEPFPKIWVWLIAGGALGGFLVQVVAWL